MKLGRHNARARSPLRRQNHQLLSDTDHPVRPVVRPIKFVDFSAILQPQNQNTESATKELKHNYSRTVYRNRYPGQPRNHGHRMEYAHTPTSAVTPSRHSDPNSMTPVPMAPRDQFNYDSSEFEFETGRSINELAKIVRNNQTLTDVDRRAKLFELQQWFSHSVFAVLSSFFCCVFCQDLLYDNYEETNAFDENAFDVAEVPLTTKQTSFAPPDPEVIDAILTSKQPSWLHDSEMSVQRSEAPRPYIEPMMPAHQYVANKMPLTLTCRAYHVDRITFKCGDKYIKNQLIILSEGVDSQTGEPYKQASTNISRQLVASHSRVEITAFQCRCHANNLSQAVTVHSNTVAIDIAVRPGHFEQIQSDLRLTIGSAAKLRCIADHYAKPPATIEWMKDGQYIDFNRTPHLKPGMYHVLQISQAKLTDSGVYKCVASNMANKHNKLYSDDIEVTVVQNGNWSDWSSWIGNCDIQGSCETIRKTGIPIQERSRKCNNPQPRNGGTPCTGGSKQTTICTQLKHCDADGGWSGWSQWESCDSSCKSVRRRSCNNPYQNNNGLHCTGPNFEQRSCIGCTKAEVDKDHRQFKVGHPRMTSSTTPGAVTATKSIESTSTSVDSSVVLYVGISLALLLFLLLVGVIVFLLKRKGNQSRNFYYATSPNINHVLGAQPDLTKNAILVHADGSVHKYTPPLPPLGDRCSFTLRSGRSDNSGTDYKDPMEYFNTPMLHGTPVSHANGTIYQNKERVGADGAANQQRNYGANFSKGPYMSGSKAALLGDSSSGSSTNPPSVGSGEYPVTNQRCPSRSSSEGHYATLGDYDPCDEQSMRNSILYASLPPELDLEGVAFGKIGCAGGRLEIPDCNVSLTIPEGALLLNQVEEFFVAVCRDPTYRPKFNDNQTVLTPIIVLGPPGVSLAKPVVVSAQHSALLYQTPSQAWQVELWGNECPPGDPAIDCWQPLVILGHETLNSIAYCQLDTDMVHVMLDVLQRICLVGHSADHPKQLLNDPQLTLPVKRMKLAAFASSYHSNDDFGLRVYCVEDTRAALFSVLREEDNLGGYLVDEPRDFGFYEGSNLCFCMEDVKSGWDVKPGANYQEIPALHVWRGVQQLHCTFSLEQLSQNGHSPHSSTLSPMPSTSAQSQQSQNSKSNSPAVQRKQTTDVITCRLLVYQKNNHANRTLLYINAPVYADSTMTSVQKHQIDARLRHLNTDDPPCQNGHSALVHKPFRIVGPNRRSICRLMDPPMESGNDWRMLATALCVDRYLNYFATKQSPTDQILDLWEARHRDSSALVKLEQIFIEIDRNDVAFLLVELFNLTPQHVSV